MIDAIWNANDNFIHLNNKLDSSNSNNSPIQSIKKKTLHKLDKILKDSKNKTYKRAELSL